MSKARLGRTRISRLDSAAASKSVGGDAGSFQEVESGSKEEQEAQQLTAAVEALARVLAAVLQRGEDRS